MSPPRPRIAILGAGPIGLEAALAAAEHGFPFTVYEAGERAGAAIAEWGHVRLFTPWELNASPRARALLAAAGCEPPREGFPTGAELIEELLLPLAARPEIAPRLRTGCRVLEVGRQGLVKSDEIGTGRRAGHRFRLLVEQRGDERVEPADLVLDCTGTWRNPNRLGDGGIPAPGERAVEAAGRLHRHPPAVAAGAAAGSGAWAGETVLLVGAGHSAQTAARDLARLATEHPGTRVIWALRSRRPGWGRIDDDPLPARAELAAAAAELAAGGSPAVEVRRGVVVEAMALAGSRGDGRRVAVTLRPRDGSADDPGVETVEVDRVLSLTGYVGDHRLYRQLQVHECYATAGPMKLAAALLGETSGDCLAQESHGADTLVNPEPGFFLLGSKSYGRNTTFLLRTGWEQVDEVLGLLAAED